VVETLGVLIAPCPRCSNLEHCIRRIVPLLRCDVCDHEALSRLVSAIRREIYVVSRVREIVLLSNMCAQSLRTMVEIASLLRSMGGDNKVSMMVSWDLLEELVISDGGRYVKRMYKCFDRLYLALLRPEDVVAVSNALKHRPLSMVKDMSVLMIEALNEDDVSKVVDAVSRFDVNPVALVIEPPIRRLLEPLMMEAGLQVVEKHRMALYDVYVYEDLRGRSIEILSPAEDDSECLVMTPDTVDECITKLRSALVAPSTRTRIVLESLCRARWVIDLKISVEGREVLDKDLARILESIDRLKSLRKAMDELGLSYPTIRSRISNLEKALGLHIVESRRGGMIRGVTDLVEEGKILLDVYRRVYEELEAYLSAILSKLCRGVD